jgi:hypothetical protein
MDPPGQLGVRLELHLLLDKVVIGLGLLERGLSVLADHDERGQEDGLQRHDEGQLRSRVRFDEDHPHREDRGVKVDKRHGTGKRRDSVRDPHLNVGGPLRTVCQDGGMVPNTRISVSHSGILSCAVRRRRCDRCWSGRR